MSTRSRIAMELSSGQYRSIYCHNDGYPSYIGRILVKNYSDPAKIAQLMDFGDLSALGEVIGEAHAFDDFKFWFSANQCRIYSRDRGNDDCEAGLHDSFADLITFLKDHSEFEDYLYVFRDNQWFYAPVWNGKLTRDLEVLTLTSIEEVY